VRSPFTPSNVKWNEEGSRYFKVENSPDYSEGGFDLREAGKNKRP
jgi:hypothetical protein